MSSWIQMIGVWFSLIAFSMSSWANQKPEPQEKDKPKAMLISDISVKEKKKPTWEDVEKERQKLESTRKDQAK